MGGGRDFAESLSSGSASPLRREPAPHFGSSLEMEALERMDSSRLLRLPSYREVDKGRIESPAESPETSFLPLSPIGAKRVEDDGMVSTAPSTNEEKEGQLDAVRRSYDHQIAMLVENWQRDVRRADELQALLQEQQRPRRRSASRPAKREERHREDRRHGRTPQRKPCRDDSEETPTPERRKRRGASHVRAKSRDRRSPQKRLRADGRHEVQSRRLRELGQGYLALHGENAELKAQLAQARRRSEQPSGDRLERWLLVGFFVVVLLYNGWLSFV